MTNAEQINSDFKGDHLTVKMFGAIGDGTHIFDGAMTSGSHTLTSASNPFTIENVGMLIGVVGAGVAGALLVTTISGYTTSGTVTLTAAASTTVSATEAIFGTDNATAFTNAFSITTDVGLASLELPSGIFCMSAGFSIPSGASLLGRGRGSSIIAYLAPSGNCVSLDQSHNVLLCDLTLLTPNGPNTAVGLYQYGVRSTRNSINVSGFNVNHYVTGNDTTQYTEDIWFDFPEVRLFQSTGLLCDHTTGLHLTQGIFRTNDSNPTNAWGMIFDTGTSGIYPEQCDLEFCGVMIRNTMPSVNSVGYPPQFFFFEKVIADTCPTHGYHLDASLGVPDGLGRVAKCLAFTNCWAAGTTVAGTDGFLIEGGQDITIISPRLRVNQRHGLHITGGEQIRVMNPYCVGNNFQNIANGAGIYIEGSTTGYVDIVGGTASNNVSGDGSLYQYWGIYIAGTYGAPFSIVDTQMIGNITGPLSNNGANALQRVIAYVDNGTTSLINRIWMNKGRLEIGDGGFYLDFYNDLAGAVALVFDANTFIRNVRGSNAIQLIASASGGMIETIGLLYTGQIQSTDICGFNTPPEMGWDTTTPTALVTTGLRLSFLATSSGQLLTVSSLGDVIASGPVGVAGGGTGDSTLAAHGVMVGEGTSPVHVTTPGTTGQVLTSNGASADPTFQANPGSLLPSSPTAHELLVGEGSSPIASIPAGAAGDFLVSLGSGSDPQFQATIIPNGLTAHGVVLGEGTGLLSASSAGNPGQPFLSGGSSSDGAYNGLQTLVASLGTDYTVTTTAASIGLSITMTQVGKYQITVCLNIAISGELEVFGYLVVGGTYEGNFIDVGYTVGPVATAVKFAASLTWTISNATAGTVAQVNANSSAASGTGTIKATNSGINAVFLG